jgi:hypothetical protein
MAAIANSSIKDQRLVSQYATEDRGEANVLPVGEA